MNNVSVEKIQLGVDYIESEFMSPLTKVGTELISDYKELNGALNSEAINRLIIEQENKLEEIQTTLKSIIDEAKEKMTESGKVIGQNQENIDETIGSI